MNASKIEILSSQLKKSDKLLIGARYSDFHLFIFSVNHLSWWVHLGWKGVKNTVKKISFPPFFLWIMTFAFFNFLNLDSVNCHRVPQHLLRYLRNWLFLQITLISDLVLATKGFGEGERLYVWPCPSPQLAFWLFEVHSYLFNVQTYSETMPHYNHQPENPTVTSLGNNIWSYKG